MPKGSASLGWIWGLVMRTRRLDLPVSPRYIERLQEMGAVVRFTSRWLNAVSVRVSPEVQRRVQAADFVVAIRPVQRLQRPRPLPPVPIASPKLLQSRYGLAFEQLAQIAVPPYTTGVLPVLGVRVALLDNGFHYAGHAAFASIRVVAQRDFVNDDEVVSDEADQPVTGDERSGSQNLHGAASTFPDGRLPSRPLCRRGTGRRVHLGQDRTRRQLARNAPRKRIAGSPVWNGPTAWGRRWSTVRWATIGGTTARATRQRIWTEKPR